MDKRCVQENGKDSRATNIVLAVTKSLALFPRRQTGELRTTVTFTVVKGEQRSASRQQRYSSANRRITQSWFRFLGHWEWQCTECASTSPVYKSKDMNWDTGWPVGHVPAHQDQYNQAYDDIRKQAETEKDRLEPAVKRQYGQDARIEWSALPLSENGSSTGMMTADPPTDEAKLRDDRKPEDITVNGWDPYDGN